jgi:hypothetical protein
MSNAAAAYYAYLAHADREQARVLRKFGYLASADYVERRAERRETRAAQEAAKEKGPSELTEEPPPSPTPTEVPT